MPLEEFWLFNGPMVALTPDLVEQAEVAAIRLAEAIPQAVFANPEYQKAAQASQLRQHESFVRIIGAASVAIPVEQAREKAPEWFRELSDGSDQGSGAFLDQAAGTVGLRSDPLTGMFFMPDVEGFLDLRRACLPGSGPSSRVKSAQRQLLGELRDSDVPAGSFRLAGEVEGSLVSEALVSALPRAGFDRHDQGEELLHRSKPHDFAAPPVPRTVPFSPRLVARRQQMNK